MDSMRGGGRLFRRILVAIDGSEAARAQRSSSPPSGRGTWIREVWFIQLAGESQQRHGGVVTDVAARGPADWPTLLRQRRHKRARNQQLVSAIAEGPRRPTGPTSVVGFDHQRLTQGASIAVCATS